LLVGFLARLWRHLREPFEQFVRRRLFFVGRDLARLFDKGSRLLWIMGGQRSLRDISAELAQQGIMNERGHPLSAASINSMLAREIGANLGLHSVPLAKFASKGRVICLEPQPIIFQMLCANIALNDLTNVFTYRAAASDANRKIAVQSSDYEIPWNYGAFSLHKGMSTEGSFPGAVTMENVSAVRLDTFDPVSRLSSLALLKIDAEQHELQVLKGAAGLIARHQPIIFVENNDAQHGDELIQHIESLGYVPYWFCSDRFQPDNFNRVGIIIPGAVANMVCFPKGRSPGIDLKIARRVSELAAGTVPLVQHVC
jgi:FkbM family methyltransferase